MTHSDPYDFRRLAEANLAGECLFGKRGWTLRRRYGRFMGGPHAGLYVSSRPASEQLEYAHRLLNGETLHIHLMHRHRSGNYESSDLQWRDGVLLMVFDDRTEVA